MRRRRASSALVALSRRRRVHPSCGRGSSSTRFSAFSGGRPPFLGFGGPLVDVLNSLKLIELVEY